MGHNITRRLVTGLPLALLTVVLAAGPAAAGGGGVSETVCSGFAEGAEVVLRDSCFEGIGHVAPTGTLTVTNEGQLPHTLTAVDGAFDTGVVQPGETATIELDAAGAFPVYCTLHGTTAGDGMAGLLSVTAATGSAAATAPTEGTNATSPAATATVPAGNAAASSDGTTAAGAGLWGGVGWAAFLVTIGAVAWARRRRTSRAPSRGTAVHGPVS